MKKQIKISNKLVLIIFVVFFVSCNSGNDEVVKQKDEKIEELKQKYKEKSNEYKDLIIEYDALLRQDSITNSENLNLKENLSSSEHDIKKLKNQLRNVKNELDELQTEFVFQTDSLFAELQQEKEKNDLLVQQLETGNVNNENLQTQITNLKDDFKNQDKIHLVSPTYKKTDPRRDNYALIGENTLKIKINRLSFLYKYNIPKTSDIELVFVLKKNGNQIGDNLTVTINGSSDVVTFNFNCPDKEKNEVYQFEIKYLEDVLYSSDKFSCSKN